MHISNTRIRRLLLAGVLALGLLALLLVVAGQRLDSQESGVMAIGSETYQFVGRIDQNGADFIGYGYLYDVQGVAPQDLFSDPLNPSESTAYLTYYATATLSARAVITDAARALFALDSMGEITYYHQATPSASFDDPQSFTNGTAVTHASLQFQDALSVQGPNHGLSIGNGKFTVLNADPFTLGSETVRFGSAGKAYQISTWGDAIRSDAIIPQSSVLLVGNAVASTGWQTYLPYVSRSDTGQ